MLFFLSIFTLTLLTTTTSSTTCHEAESCKYISLTEVDTDIECYGYFSCAYAQKIQLNVSEGYYRYIECFGSFSCYQATALITLPRRAHIDCKGLFSCAEVDLVSVATDEDNSGWLFFWAQVSRARHN